MANTEKRKEFLRAVKFTLFSLSAGIVQVISVVLLFDVLHLPEEIAHLIALIASVVWNFTLNRKFTFQSASNVQKAMLLVLAYYAVFTPVSTLLVKWLTEKVIWTGWNGWEFYFIEAIVMLLNFVTEFLYQRYVVFKDSIDTAVKK